MKIPHSFIDEVKEDISISFKGVYEEYIDEVDFNDFFEDILTGVLYDINNLLEVTMDNVQVYSERRRSTKRNWVKKELNGNHSFYKSVDVVAKSVFVDVMNSDPVKFESVYGCKNPEALKEKIKEEMSKWESDESQPLSYFKYIKDKTKRQIKIALSNDIKYLLYKNIQEHYPRGMRGEIASLPILMSEMPIDYTNRGRMETNNVVDIEGKPHYSTKYYVDDNRFLESFIDIDVLKTGVLKSVFRTLNANDLNVFIYLMTLRDENFYTTREIIADIGDIVKNAFGSTGKKNYMAAKESLYRMEHLSSGMIDENLRGFTVKILDNVDIVRTESNKELAKVVFNIDIVAQYIKNQTVNLYNDIIKHFELKSSKIGIFPIQRARIRVATSGGPDDTLIFHTNYNFFRGFLYFPNKRKRENIKDIEDMLKEMIENKIAIIDYVRKGDMFALKFYPITEEEREDLLNTEDKAILRDLEVSPLGEIQ